MKTIPLTQGKFALVDDADYAELSQFKWYANKDNNTFYAHRAIKNKDGPGRQRTLHMHQEIMEIKGKIDHRDGDGLNNQRCNLRPATTRQNGQNRRKFAPSASKFKGVDWQARGGEWRARIKACGQRHHLGCFKTEIEAAQAYDAAARKYFGDFCSLNFPI